MFISRGLDCSSTGQKHFFLLVGIHQCEDSWLVKVLRVSECSGLCRIGTFCLDQSTGNIAEEEAEKSIRAGGWVLWKAAFWTWHGYHTHELTAAMAAWTRPSHDQASPSPSIDGGVGLQVPPLVFAGQGGTIKEGFPRIQWMVPNLCMCGHQ